MSFARDVYTEIADAETLDEVVDYLREVVPDADQSPAAVDETLRQAGEMPGGAD